MIHSMNLGRTITTPVRRSREEVAMGHGVKLTEEQWDELDRLRFSTSSADIFRNCLIILMSDSRDTIASIADHLGCGTDTVVRVRRLYRKGGVAPLVPIKPPGRKSKASPEFLQAMGQAVQTSPLDPAAELVGGAVGRVSGQDHRHPLSATDQLRASVASGGFLACSGPSTR